MLKKEPILRTDLNHTLQSKNRLITVEDYQFLTGISELEARKAMLNLSQAEMDEILFVPENTKVVLGLNEKVSVRERNISTSSLDVFKSWIGRTDAEADNHPWEMPTAEWNGKLFQTKAELSAMESSNIEKAGWIYLFNDSRKVSAYKKAIETYNGSFTAKVYAIRKLVISAGAQLIIAGEPAILLIDELIIVDGGSLLTKTISHATIGKLIKTSNSESPLN